MEVIVNAIITKVYEGASGTSQHGAWQIFNFYVKDRKEKFSCFGNEKFTPKEGMVLKLLKYEIKTKGEYTNYNVKEAITEDSPQPQAGVQAKPQGRDFYAENFGKCKFGFLQQAFVPWAKGEIYASDPKASINMIEQDAEHFAVMSMRMLSRATTAPQTAKETKDVPARASEEPDRDIPPISAYEEMETGTLY